MAVESIGGVASRSTALQNAGLGQEDFLKILLTQLSFQDPLKPMDNQEFIAQMAQFTNLELTRQQGDRTDTLLTIQSATQAIGLINKTVGVIPATVSKSVLLSRSSSARASLIYRSSERPTTPLFAISRCRR